MSISHIISRFSQYSAADRHLAQHRLSLSTSCSAYQSIKPSSLVVLFTGVEIIHDCPRGYNSRNPRLETGTPCKRQSMQSLATRAVRAIWSHLPCCVGPDRSDFNALLRGLDFVNVGNRLVAPLLFSLPPARVLPCWQAGGVLSFCLSARANCSSATSSRRLSSWLILISLKNNIIINSGRDKLRELIAKICWVCR